MTEPKSLIAGGPKQHRKDAPERGVRAVPVRELPPRGGDIRPAAKILNDTH